MSTHAINLEFRDIQFFLFQLLSPLPDIINHQIKIPDSLSRYSALSGKQEQVRSASKFKDCNRLLLHDWAEPQFFEKLRGLRDITNSQDDMTDCRGRTFL